MNAYLEHHHPESENLDAQVLTLPLSLEFARGVDQAALDHLQVEERSIMMSLI
jgi:hypothetical protein